MGWCATTVNEGCAESKANGTEGMGWCATTVNEETKYFDDWGWCMIPDCTEVKQEQLGMGSEKGEYYSTTATVSFFQKDKALYKACGRETDGRQCNKKVTECGGDIYRCEKCGDEKPGFAWRLMLQMNVADCTDNTWASCFQETAEKIP